MTWNQTWKDFILQKKMTLLEWDFIILKRPKTVSGPFCPLLPTPRGRLNIKMPSYQHRDSHVKDKTVSLTVLSLTWDPHTCERRSLFWDGAQIGIVATINTGCHQGSSKSAESGIILCMGSANERRHYIETLSLIGCGCAHIQNDVEPSLLGWAHTQNRSRVSTNSTS